MQVLWRGNKNILRNDLQKRRNGSGLTIHFSNAEETWNPVVGTLSQGMLSVHKKVLSKHFAPIHVVIKMQAVCYLGLRLEHYETSRASLGAGFWGRGEAEGGGGAAKDEDITQKASPR